MINESLHRNFCAKSKFHWCRTDTQNHEQELSTAGSCTPERRNTTQIRITTRSETGEQRGPMNKCQRNLDLEEWKGTRSHRGGGIEAIEAGPVRGLYTNDQLAHFRPDIDVKVRSIQAYHGVVEDLHVALELSSQSLELGLEFSVLLQQPIPLNRQVFNPLREFCLGSPELTELATPVGFARQTVGDHARLAR